MAHKRRKWLVIVLVAVSFVLFWYLCPMMGTGSPSYAQKWSKQLKQCRSLEDAQTRYPNIFVYSFSQTEWFIGVCDDSHSSAWGGTIVLRDYTGKVHCFFGHVCSSGFLRALFCRKDIRNIEEARLKILSCDFQEYQTK